MPWSKAEPRLIAILLALLLGGAPGLSLEVRAMQPQSKASRDWAEIEKLLTQGNQLLDEEDAGHGNVEKRRRVFKEVAEKMEKFIHLYLPENTVKHVITLFRMGRAWERGGYDIQAIAVYERCDQHPLKSHPQAIYDGTSLITQIRNRIDYLRPKIKAEQSPKGIIIREGGGSNSKQE